MAGGTTFRFIDTNPADALRQAVDVAGGKDVRVGGGATLVRDFLKERLVDRLQVAIAPILLGRGIRLWEDLRGFDLGYSVEVEAAESGTVHLTFSGDTAVGAHRTHHCCPAAPEPET